MSGRNFFWVGPTPQRIKLEHLDKLHPVCKQNLESAIKATDVKLWQEDLSSSQVDSLTILYETIFSRYNAKPKIKKGENPSVDQLNVFGDFMSRSTLIERSASVQTNLAAEIEDEPLRPEEKSEHGWQSSSIDTLYKPFRDRYNTTPELLYYLYLTTRMKRSIIKKHLEKVKQKQTRSGGEQIAVEETEAGESQIPVEKNAAEGPPKALEQTKAEKSQMAVEEDRIPATETQTEVGENLQSILDPRMLSQQAASDTQKATKKANNDEGGERGTSASGWRFVQLVDLCCIPLFGVQMDAIIDNFKMLREQVLANEDVTSYLAQITTASKEDLSSFKPGQKMSSFLKNPWCLFFSSLRDHLSRGDAELQKASQDRSREEASNFWDEDNLEHSSEQLLHRFMEIILLLFSKLCNDEDKFRSTPSRVDAKMCVGIETCTILDDGYVYVSRAGTSGHGPSVVIQKESQFKTKRRSPAPPAYNKTGGNEWNPSNRNRHGKTPIMRYEAKRLGKEPDSASSATSQIFSELLSAAWMNMKYFEDNTAGKRTTSIIGESNARMRTEASDRGMQREENDRTYHDAFVIHVRHYQLTIHTARFPRDYLHWVINKNVPADSSETCKQRYCILQKVSVPYDLSEPSKRLAAAEDILALLLAIKSGDLSPDGEKIFVARACIGQTVGKQEPTVMQMQTDTKANIKYNGTSQNRSDFGLGKDWVNSDARPFNTQPFLTDNTNYNNNLLGHSNQSSGTGYNLFGYQSSGTGNKLFDNPRSGHGNNQFNHGN